MSLAEIVALAGQALSLYNGLKAAAQAQGLTPEEFDKSADAECKRLDAWKKKTDAAEDALFLATDKP